MSNKNKSEYFEDDAWCYEIQPLDNGKVQQQDRKTENTRFQIMAILIGSLVSLSAGISMSWPSPFIVYIVNDKEHYNITEEEASYFTMISTIGVIVLPIIWIPVVTKYGRKKLLLAITLPYIVSYLIKAFARNVWLFYFARFLNGVGDSITFTCIIVYIAEIATPEVRGVWGNAVVWNGFLGQFIVNVLGIYCSITVTSFICAFFPLLFFVTFVFLPETPYFYIEKGRDEDAKKSLRRLRCTENVDEEFKKLKFTVEHQLSSVGTWKDLITDRVHRRALFTSMFLRVGQILSGLYSIGAYTQFIFEKTGTNINAELSTLLYTFLNFVLYSASSYGSNLLGRRKSLISSLIITAVIFLLEATYFFVDDYYPKIDLSSIQWFPLAGLLGFLIFSSYGVGTVPFVMAGELFSTSIKAKGIAVVISMYGLFNLITNAAFYNLNSVAGLGGPFLFFGICNIISAVITYKFVPETKNKTLEEIQTILSEM